MSAVLYGKLRPTKSFDLVFILIKVLYIAYTLPFLVFIHGMYIKSVGAFGNPLTEEFGIVKKMLLHVSAIVCSFGLWLGIFALLVNLTGVHIRIPIF